MLLALYKVIQKDLDVLKKAKMALPVLLFSTVALK